MKAIVPALVLLGACSSSPDLDPLREEISSLRQEVQELRKVHAPSLEAAEAMDDLAREVKKLREKTTPPPAPVPLPPVREIPKLLPLPSGSLTGGVGGTQAGVNDLFWVLARVALEGGEEWTVLALYKATSHGFKLAGVRRLGADLQIVELNQDKPAVKAVMEALKRK
ncbi:MAG: hypothetical protein EHM91_06750 [Planctomycetota bacterium]|nr:MAG: hypothetical protein EHM91_06750 [Planctomycetota bacterium]